MNDDGKVYLLVPFRQKDEAKRLGAKWDPDKKMWFSTDYDNDRFKKWFLPEILPVKDLRVIDKSKWIYAPVNSPKLYIDLIPETSWCTNLRSGLEAHDWDLIRKAVYRFGGYICDICKGVGPAHPVEAHERWEYDTDNLVQRLVGVSCLCPACHQATHFGLANIHGKADIAGNHLKSINKWTDEEVNEHIDKSFDTWKFRSSLNWELDISWLIDCEIPLSETSMNNIERFSDYWTFNKHVIKNRD